MDNAPLPRGWMWFFIVSLVLGAILRLSFGGDIEFKYDEWFMFGQTRKAGISEPVPTLGMQSGAGIRNPPLSIWIFLALSRVVFADTPPELARGVQGLNVLALALLLAFAWRWAEPGRKEAWLWTMALACVNPFAVLLQRKIWAQSTLPLFCMLFILGWSRRGRRGGALLWGFFGVWLGQLHMSGFIFAAAVVVWTFVAGILRKESGKVAWGAWAAGSLLGSLTMVTWLHYYLLLDRNFSLERFLSYWFHQPLLHTLFWQLWISGPLGLGLSYSLGDSEFFEYLKYPLLGGGPTYLMGAAHLVILGLAGWAAFRWLAQSGRQPLSLKNMFLGKPGSDTRLLLAAGCIGYGIFLTLTGIYIPRHYLLVTFPLEWLGWVLIFQKAFAPSAMRRALVALWVCQLILSLGYLGYIHVNHGAKTGDYGVGFQYQQEN